MKDGRAGTTAADSSTGRTPADLPSQATALATEPRLDLHDGRFYEVTIDLDAQLVAMADAPAGSIGERRFEIEFLDAGAEAYCFTFG
jgi:hypothetical protein